MPIAREDGFFRTNDLTHSSSLGIESSRLSECVTEVKRSHIRGVFGSPCFGFTGQNLDFLPEVEWVESVWFWDVNLKDIDGLYSLENLRHFGVHPKRPAIDFSRFKKLQKVIIEPRSKDRGLDELKELELLHVWHFKPKDGTFSELAIPSSLIELQINWANPESLETLPALPNLRSLEIHRCRNLERLDALAEKYPNLETLIVTTSGRVTVEEGTRAVRGLNKLVHAHVAGKKVA